MYRKNISHNTESLKTITNIVASRLRRPLHVVEITDLRKFVEGNENRDWSGYSISDTQRALANAYIKYKFTESGRKAKIDDEAVIDVHEIMRNGLGTADQEPDYEAVDNVNSNGVPTILEGAKEPEAKEEEDVNNISTVSRIVTLNTVNNLQGFLGKTDDVSIQQLFNPTAAWRKNYIILDSRYRNTETDGRSAISWSFLANTSDNAPGGVNSIGDVQQIVSISCPPIRIPYKESILLNGYRRVSLLINEFSGQACIAQEGRRYHFMFSSAVDGNMIELTPVQGDQATFEFAKPITHVDKLTVTFGSPLERILFDEDRTIMRVFYTNPAELVSQTNHELNTGDQVYITGFTTTDTVVDANIINTVNRVEGHNIIVVDQTTIQIDGLDLTTVLNQINPLQVNVFFGSKRILIPLELKYVAKAQKNNF